MGAIGSLSTLRRSRNTGVVRLLYSRLQPSLADYLTQSAMTDLTEPVGVPCSHAPLPMPNAAAELDDSGDLITEVQHAGRIVVVGANGSGKSRLGAWLENPLNLGGNNNVNLLQRPATAMRAYRIGAQRSLGFPDTAQRMDLQSAERRLLAGESLDGPPSFSRVKGDAVVGQMQDFEILVNALFAERTEQDRLYRERGFRTEGKPGIPEEDVITRAKRVWEAIFPERLLSIENHAVFAAPLGGATKYRAGRLSDGERVGFYLTAHALLAPKNGILVIDEPELHLHPTIQSSLWNALEQEREDCTFVYITHDLAFAASRVRHDA
jgi:ABC-type glutathione transport system ATPase component